MEVHEALGAAFRGLAELETSWTSDDGENKKFSSIIVNKLEGSKHRLFGHESVGMLLTDMRSVPCYAKVIDLNQLSSGGWMPAFERSGKFFAALARKSVDGSAIVVTTCDGSDTYALKEANEYGFRSLYQHLVDGNQYVELTVRPDVDVFQFDKAVNDLWMVTKDKTRFLVVASSSNLAIGRVRYMLGSSAEMKVRQATSVYLGVFKGQELLEL